MKHILDVSTCWAVAAAGFFHLPIAPSCCGDNDVSGIMPGIDPEARDNLSENAMIEPPGDTERADALEPATEIISEKRFRA